jgi:hypothetical protein
VSEGVLIRICRAVREGQYEFTDHLLEEAAADGLTTDEALEVLLTGALDSTYSDDPRGVRYIVRGDVGAVEVDVVCRFNRDTSVLVIITVYAAD